MHNPPERVRTVRAGLTWESFGASALWRLVGLMVLLVVVLGVITASFEVALNTARISLVVLFVLACWLYVVWFRRQKAELSRRDEIARGDVARDDLKNFRP